MTMTVKELIAELSKCDPDSKVLISVGGLNNKGYKLIADGTIYDPNYEELCVQEVCRSWNGKTVYIGEMEEDEE